MTGSEQVTARLGLSETVLGMTLLALLVRRHVDMSYTHVVRTGELESENEADDDGAVSPSVPFWPSTRTVVAARPDRSSRCSIHLFDNHRSSVPAMISRVMASSKRRFIVITTGTWRPYCR